MESKYLKWDCIIESKVWNKRHGCFKGYVLKFQNDSKQLKCQINFNLGIWMVLESSFERLLMNENFVIKINKEVMIFKCGKIHIWQFWIPFWESWGKMSFGCSLEESLGICVFFDDNCSWFIHALFWFQIILTTFYLVWVIWHNCELNLRHQPNPILEPPPFFSLCELWNTF